MPEIDLAKPLASRVHSQGRMRYSQLEKLKSLHPIFTAEKTLKVVAINKAFKSLLKKAGIIFLD